MNIYNFNNSQWEENGYLFIQQKKTVSKTEFLNQCLNKLEELKFLIMSKETDLINTPNLTKEEYDTLISSFEKSIESEVQKELNNYVIGNKIKEEWNEKIFYFETDIYYGFYMWETSA